MPCVAAKKPAVSTKKPAVSTKKPPRAGGPPRDSLAGSLLAPPSRSARAPVPFSFVLEALEACDPVVRPMFGAHAIYVGERIVMIVRKRDSAREANGVWLATTAEHHASLKREFPMLRSVSVLQDPKKPEPTGWQMIPDDDDDFDQAAERACALIRRGDPRIGKIPGAKKKKKVAGEKKR